MRGRRARVEVWYNNVPFNGELGADLLSFEYVESAADRCDSVRITFDARDPKWLGGWMPQRGAALRARIVGEDWDGDGVRRELDCGTFVLDTVRYSDTPTVMELEGTSKPGDEDFSEQERNVVWQNTSVKRIAQEIAQRYGLGFGYEGEDYEIEADEQEATDSAYLQDLCGRYGLCLKAFNNRLWVYDREEFKSRRAVADFDRKHLTQGSLQYEETIAGLFTAGVFRYTDSGKNLDYECSIGEGNTSHTKNVNQKCSSLYDASVQLCAALNNANHGKISLGFALMGTWQVSAGDNIRLTGYGPGLTTGINGKYFVDSITHRVDRSGFVSRFECSGIRDPFQHWNVGGEIRVHEESKKKGTSADGSAGAGSAGGYTSSYETTSPAAKAQRDWMKTFGGQQVVLDGADVYLSAAAEKPVSRKSGTYYLYDGAMVNGRYRISNAPERCGRQPPAKYGPYWVKASEMKR